VFPSLVFCRLLRFGFCLAEIYKSARFGNFGGRPFFSFAGLPNKSPEAVNAAEALPFSPVSISGSMDPVNTFAESGVAVPDFLGTYQGSSGSLFKSSSVSGFRSGKAAGGPNSRFATIASVILDSPFSQLFSSVFQVNQADDVFLNPFTEARKKQEDSPDAARSDAKTQAADKASSDSPESPEASKTESADSAAAAPGAGTAASDWFLIVGDFDGSGILSALPARRSGDTSFVSDDGERNFNLFINSAAAEQQRAFYIDDINGDGNPDLLVTRREALSGGVFLGDGEGGYRFSDKFLTGYEPTIPGAGPLREGHRDILTVNTRTGVLRTFRAAESYKISQKQQLDFVPNYLLHLVAEEGSAEFLMVGQVQGRRRIMSWIDNCRLEATAESLPAEPLVFSSDLGSDSVQAYQVGNYASVILSSQGYSFNVANLRLFPGVFLLIGDLYRDGSAGVAVGNLKHFTPAQSLR
jgi:hypothetical protein